METTRERAAARGRVWRWQWHRRWGGKERIRRRQASGEARRRAGAVAAVRGVDPAPAIHALPQEHKSILTSCSVM
uniref:Uncharacterized protein n=1 Tax=Oryza punctata TaxID=4537 RepID=A0A0E0MBF3_ORYPU